MKIENGKTLGISFAGLRGFAGRFFVVFNTSRIALTVFRAEDTSKSDFSRRGQRIHSEKMFSHATKAGPKWAGGSLERLQRPVACAHHGANRIRTMQRSLSGIVGWSVLKRPIRLVRFSGADRGAILVIAGIHGDEPKSVYVVKCLIDLLRAAESRWRGPRWLIVPLANPDGYDKRKRGNARGVDLNRNFPTRDWRAGRSRGRMYGGERPVSEPETRALVRLIQRERPDRILSVHSISGGKECNNYDGPARSLAQRMARVNGYPVTSTMGYPTPGSLGTWAGKELGIPIVTLELPTRCSAKQCWENHRDAVLSFGLGPVQSKRKHTSARRAQRAP